MDKFIQFIKPGFGSVLQFFNDVVLNHDVIPHVRVKQIAVVKNLQILKLDYILRCFTHW